MDGELKSDAGWGTGKRLVLSERVRVRREAFGLLFYNSADTKLTFVRSGKLLEVEKHEHFSALKVNQGKGEEAAVRCVMELLLRKGLIIEAETGV